MNTLMDTPEAMIVGEAEVPEARPNPAATVEPKADVMGWLPRVGLFVALGAIAGYLIKKVV